MRFCTPNAQIMIHQPSGGYQGQATDIMIHAQFTERLKRRLNEIYVRHTGQDYETIHNAMERDNFLTTEQALELGLIDKVLTSREEIEGVGKEG
jgi:ATP-dependent Clp protease protease subunit